MDVGLCVESGASEGCKILCIFKTEHFPWMSTGIGYMSMGGNKLEIQLQLQPITGTQM